MADWDYKFDLIPTLDILFHPFCPRVSGYKTLWFVMYMQYVPWTNLAQENNARINLAPKGWEKNHTICKAFHWSNQIKRTKNAKKVLDAKHVFRKTSFGLFSPKWLNVNRPQKKKKFLFAQWYEYDVGLELQIISQLDSACRIILIGGCTLFQNNNQ